MRRTAVRTIPIWLRLSIATLALFAAVACGDGDDRNVDAMPVPADDADEDAGDQDAADGGVAEPLPGSAMGCGVPGTRCCHAQACSNDGCCVRGICVAAGRQCRVAAGVCSAGHCGGCGGAGQPCCQDDAAPASGGSFCTQGGTTCVPTAFGKSVCTPCGRAPGAACCSDNGCLGALICGGTGLCQACGQPGQDCCSDHPCAGEGCCVAGRCVELAQTCDSFAPTTQGTCTGGRCSRCGGEDQPCCAGSGGCREGLCTGGICRRCGREGEACCASPGACLPGLGCGIGKTCEACGAVGQLCCETGTLCHPAADIHCTLDANGVGRCLPPGKIGEACVLEGGCVAGAVCAVDLSDFAHRGTCVACGGPGQLCCPGRVCTAGCCTYESTCAAIGQTCAAGACDGHSCGGCGGRGEPCCKSVGGQAFCSDAGTTCVFDALPPADSTHCEACGDLGQRCCRPTRVERDACLMGLQCSGSLGLGICGRR
jgi:hypothetical protein